MATWTIVSDIIMFILIGGVGGYQAWRIKTQKGMIDEQKTILESSKLLVEMFDIEKIKQIYDEKIKDSERKHKKAIESAVKQIEQNTKDITKDLTAIHVEYTSFILMLLFYLKPVTREKIYDRVKTKEHIIQTLDQAYELAGDIYISDPDLTIMDLLEQFEVGKEKDVTEDSSQSVD